MSLVGRLIFPDVAVLQFLDTQATRAASGYDDEFREPVLSDSNADGLGEPQTIVSAETKVPAQVATRLFERLEAEAHGQVLDTPNLELTFHLRDLKRLGLLESDGRPKIQVGTRVVRIEDKAGGTLWTFPDPPGMFVVAARPSGFLGRRNNLLVCTLSDRRQADPFPESDVRQL